ncbi:uncharacterized protein TM35_000211540 [Trypanosoma theileri]|uniref:Uncharacterized protein n=1 Tax=Trypanosoma theileri TaxID=67003 RepID=A0A1X0NSL7_9TRYP|nr:uncharacterized protein TM35_000211540 [Trypanosoma theileri]ORC87548.1 hypothetical protein TM35_000211540 [Trypanosoma theileri]
MMDFDLLDDAEEILQPLCLCFNQDYSRVGVGHHNGYVIYRIHRNTPTTPIITTTTTTTKTNSNSNNTTTTASMMPSTNITVTTNTNTGTSGGGGGQTSTNTTNTTTTAKPPFYTTVEAVFPPRCTTTSTSPVVWEVPVASAEDHNTEEERRSVEASNICLTECIQEKSTERLLGFMANAFQQEEKEKEENEEKEVEGMEREKEEACESDKKKEIKNEGEAHLSEIEIDTGGFSAARFSDNSTHTHTATISYTDQQKRKGLEEGIEAEEEEERECPVLAPRESGVGVMALLYKTHFVAVVGGGPYPVGPRNVVKLFVLGSLWADRTVRVPDIVQGLHLDHRLMIILTTAQLRLHSFETGQCVFALPVNNENISTSGGLAASIPSMLGTAAPLASTVLFQNNSNHYIHENSMNTVGSTIDASTGVSTVSAAALRSSVPLAVDYNNKYLVFRSSLRGFSLVRYDTDSSLCSRIKTELLATVPDAHEHTVASLAMYIGNEFVSNCGSNRNDNNSKLLSSITSTNTVATNTGYGCRNVLIATSSEHATLIRIWRYCENCEKPETLSCSGIADAEVHSAANKDTHPNNNDNNNNNNNNTSNENHLPGYFVKVKEVRNATLPTPIFQLQFLGDNFLFCIAWNTIKVFFIGEVEEPKPYDVSIRDQSKCMRAQNIHSSLYRLGMVSGYFNSEWAACECPLPLLDEVFLPKWVHAATMELRQHLLRGVSSRKKSNDFSRETSEVGIVNPPHHHPHPHHPSSSSSRESTASEETPQDVLAASSLNNVSTGVSSRKYWGGYLRQYLSLPVAPVMETATRVARRYWSGSENEINTGMMNLSGTAGEKKTDPVSGVKGGNNNNNNNNNNNINNERDYSTMTEVAQALVVWWERPAYRHVDYMTSAALRNRDGPHDTLLPTMGTSEAMTLYCVTCDGSAISFEFDPMKGSITCSEAVPVANAEN